MKRIAIAGVTGMLGNRVYSVFKDDVELVLLYRDDTFLDLLDKHHGGVKKHKSIKINFMALYKEYEEGFNGYIGKAMSQLIDQVGSIDAFINCAGIIKPYVTQNPVSTFFINSALPHILSRVYKDKLIHITTDCVFSGIGGAPYNEHSEKLSNDLYGLSKSLGEPRETSLVIRTSFVGSEIAHFQGLYEWLKRQKKKRIKGFTNHIWNGITTKQMAMILKKITSDRREFPKVGLYHIYSNPMTKYEMLVKFKKKLKSEVHIEPYETPTSVDRRLTSVHDLCKRLKIPSFDRMLEEL